MATIEVQTRAPYSKVLALVYRLPAIVSGKDSEYARVHEACLGAALHSLLDNIQKDWIIKADGNQGEDGIKWPELSYRQLKYRLQKPEVGINTKGLSDEKLDQLRTLIPILIDTRRLITSFAPGPINGTGTESAYRSPAEQEVQYGVGTLEMNSGVPYAIEHQTGNRIHGDTSVPLPQRQMVADVFPDRWVEEMNEAFRDKLVECIKEIVSKLT